MNSRTEILERGFGGDIVEPGAQEYAAASRSLFASGHPAYVLRPNSVGDVQAAVRFATESGLVLSVRGGGHGFPGFATNDGGVVIDLSNLATVEIIDDDQHVVRIGGGANWGQVADGLAPQSLAISVGRHQQRRCRRPHLGRRHRLEGPQVRLGTRPGGRRRHGHRRRNRRACKRAGEPGTVLGDPRWRRQLRDRDGIRVRGTPNDRRLLRQDRVSCVGNGRRAAGLGGLHADRA